MAFDWAWEKGQAQEDRDFKIVQSSPSLFFPELMHGGLSDMGGRVRAAR